MTTPEGIVEAYLVKRVRETGGRVRKLKWIGRNNAPDRLVWWPTGKSRLADVYFVELKAPSKKPTPAQKEEHNEMRDSGLRVLVIDTEAKVDAFIEQVPMATGRFCL